MDKDYLYVIGTSPHNLINITFSGWEERIIAVRFGEELRDFATTFASLSATREALKEIQSNKNYISFSNATVFLSVIEGNELDVDKLKIYSVGIIEEVTQYENE